MKKFQQYLNFVISVLKVTAYHHHSQHAVVLCAVQVLVPSPALWATLGKKLTLSNPLFLACKMEIEIGGMGRHPVAWPLPAHHSGLLPLLPMGCSLSHLPTRALRAPWLPSVCQNSTYCSAELKCSHKGWSPVSTTRKGTLKGKDLVCKLSCVPSISQH